MPAFDLVVLGSGGGPYETNLSAYLLKTHSASWEDGMIALDAGSGLGALDRLLDRHPDLFGPVHKCDPPRGALDIYSFVRCFLITHAHLDHVNGLVLSAGSLKPLDRHRRIHGFRSVLKNLDLLFSGRVWPKLATWDPTDEPYKLLLDPLTFDNTFKVVHPDVSVMTMPISHGLKETTSSSKEASCAYESSVFFIRQISSGHEFLFFGDVEPDSVALKKQTRAVWRAAAHKIPDVLSAVFIECSWPSGRKDAELYGHLSPEHLSAELTVLASEVASVRRGGGGTPVAKGSNGHTRKKRRPNPVEASVDELRGALRGLRVYVMHCKNDMGELITEQVKALVEAKGLGAEVLRVDQGTHICELSSLQASTVSVRGADLRY
ncbi:cyclic-AMP phosphodiesterase [Amylostereum chailletii]|nr:cyclic-AMP phosphodiesterase [Amylostereum chailletii]